MEARMHSDRMEQASTQGVTARADSRQTRANCALLRGFETSPAAIFTARSALMTLTVLLWRNGSGAQESARPLRVPLHLTVRVRRPPARSPFPWTGRFPDAIPCPFRFAPWPVHRRCPWRSPPAWDPKAARIRQLRRLR